MKRNSVVHAAVTRTVLALLVTVLGFSVTVKADAVTDWNMKTVQYAATGGRPGPTFVLDIAVAQAAVYDAVQAYAGEYRPYCGAISPAAGSPIAAVAKAARDVLVARFPGQAAAIHADYLAYLAANSLDETNPGIAVGQSAAACMAALRAGDGSFPNPPWPPFIGGTEPGDWRPTPPANAAMVGEWLGYVTPFTMRSPTQFRAGPPPRLNSPEYTRAYNEVKALGSATGSQRTVDQTELANFWNGNFPGQMNALARQLGMANGNSLSQNSRLLALVDLAMADSLIAAWADKRFYNFWRPITAIQLGDADGNNNTVGDPAWTPMVTTPPYQDHTSGANNIAGSATRALSLFFGTNEMNFTIATTNPGPTTNDTRSYTKFSQVRDEVVEARILQGIHFRFADQDARKQGEHIAQWAFSHYFKPAN